MTACVAVMHSYSCQRCSPWAPSLLNEKEPVQYPARTYLSRWSICKRHRFNIFDEFSDIRKRQKIHFSDTIIWYFDFWISNMPFIDITNNSHFLISKFRIFDIKQLWYQKMYFLKSIIIRDIKISNYWYQRYQEFILWNQKIP